MELKERKRINNLPRYNTGLIPVDTKKIEQLPMDQFAQGLGGAASIAAAANPWLAAGAFAAEGLTNGLNKVLTTAEDIQNQAGTTVGQGAGFQYNRANNVDVNKMMSDYKKDTAASLLSNPIESLTKWIGTKRYRRTVNQALQNQISQNKFNYSDAQSEYLSNDYMKNHYNPTDDLLYAVNGNDGTYEGPAMVSKGEVQVDNLDSNNPNKAKFKKITKGKPFADDQKTNVKRNTVIFGSLIDPVTGNMIQDEARPIADKYNNAGTTQEKTEAVNEARMLLDRQVMARKQQNPRNKKQNIPHAVYGDDGYYDPLLALKEAYTGGDYGYTVAPTPVYSDPLQEYKAAYTGGEYRPQYSDVYTDPNEQVKKEVKTKSPRSNKIKMNYNDAIGTFGTLTALGRHIKAALDTVHKPNTYVANPYYNQIMNDLNDAKVNPYPILNKMYAANRMGRYANNRSGGLSGAQKYIGNVAQSIGMDANIGNMLFGWRQNEIQDKLKRTELKNSISATETQRKQQAAQHDLPFYVGANNARDLKMQGGSNDVFAQNLQWVANRLKLDNFNDLYHLYSTDPKRFNG